MIKDFFTCIETEKGRITLSLNEDNQSIVDVTTAIYKNDKWITEYEKIKLQNQERAIKNIILTIEQTINKFQENE